MQSHRSWSSDVLHRAPCTMHHMLQSCRCRRKVTQITMTGRDQGWRRYADPPSDSFQYVNLISTSRSRLGVRTIVTLTCLLLSCLAAGLVDLRFAVSACRLFSSGRSPPAEHNRPLSFNNECYWKTDQQRNAAAVHPIPYGRSGSNLDNLKR